MPALPSLALARMILRAYFDDDFLFIIVYGGLRRGKTAYTLKCVDQVLEYLGRKKLGLTNINEYVGWKPREVINTWMHKPTGKQPVFVWDDAGVWLNNAKWTDPLLQAIAEYMNLVGTDYACLMLTTPKPQWILGKIASMPEMLRIKIVKRSGDTGGGQYLENRDKFSRRAVGYKPWFSPDLKKHGVNKILEDDFSCKIRDDLYAVYKPMREGYNVDVKQNMMDELTGKAKKHELKELQGDVKLARWQDQINTLTKRSEKEMKRKSKQLKKLNESQMENNIDALIDRDLEKMETDVK